MSEAKGDPLSRSLCPFSVKNAFIKKAPIQNNRIGAYAQSLFDVDNFNVEGQVFSFFVMVVAAAEVVIGLAIVVSIFRTHRSASLDGANQLKH